MIGRNTGWAAAALVALALLGGCATETDGDGVTSFDEFLKSEPTVPNVPDKGGVGSY